MKSAQRSMPRSPKKTNILKFRTQIKILLYQKATFVIAALYRRTMFRFLFANPLGCYLYKKACEGNQFWGGKFPFSFSLPINSFSLHVPPFCFKKSNALINTIIYFHIAFLTKIYYFFVKTRRFPFL